ncbi:hypothetical protein MA16_Dca014582 [Dendrobium catenatum]|uniref:Uncharacterized protein n=1 Tax=Dendrobium catenatum TaxID=906689 RepID=A0A2I0XJR9_9ASPA|nr:hypothetical protein MA16_Dca014582 [Dendrobium catenatum]
MPPSILRDPGFFFGGGHSKSFLQALAGSTSSFPDLKRSTFRGLPALLVSDDEIRVGKYSSKDIRDQNSWLNDSSEEEVYSEFSESDNDFSLVRSSNATRGKFWGRGRRKR